MSKTKLSLVGGGVVLIALASIGIYFGQLEQPTENLNPTVKDEEIDSGFQSVCQKDPLIPEEWKDFEAKAFSQGGCARPFRYVSQKVVGVPVTSLSPDKKADFFCGIKPNSNFMAGREFGVHFDPEYKIHVVGITDEVHSSDSSPEKDYAKYFRFVAEAYEAMTDAPSDYQITFSDSYIEIEKDFSKLNLGFGTKTEVAQNALAQKVIEKIDPELDFSKIDKLFIFVPPNISRDVFEHSGTYSGDFSSLEGPVSGPFLGGSFEEFDHPDWIPHGPIGFMHEIFHLAGGVIDDHYGEWQPGSDEFRQKGPAPGGTGEWGNMSGILMDWLAWDKYLAQMITDDQVRCVSGNQEEIVWLRPSTHDTKDDKLILIPTGTTTAIAIESIRASGFNFKIPKKYHGALVYEIDTSMDAHGLGVRVIRPEFRNGPGWSPTRTSEFDFALADATLKNGEKMEIGPIVIQVIESGEFGDVVRVQKK